MHPFMVKWPEVRVWEGQVCNTHLGNAVEGAWEVGDG